MIDPDKIAKTPADPYSLTAENKGGQGIPGVGLTQVAYWKKVKKLGGKAEHRAGPEREGGGASQEGEVEAERQSCTAAEVRAAHRNGLAKGAVYSLGTVALIGALGAAFWSGTLYGHRAGDANVPGAAVGASPAGAIASGRDERSDVAVPRAAGTGGTPEVEVHVKGREETNPAPTLDDPKRGRVEAADSLPAAKQPTPGGTIYDDLLDKDATVKRGESGGSSGQTKPTERKPRHSAGGGLYAMTGGGHWIDTVSSDGAIIKLEDGSVWKVSTVGQIDTALWLPVSSITVLEGDEPGWYVLVNSDDGEKAPAKYLGGE